MLKEKEKTKKYESKNMNLPEPVFDAYDKNFTQKESLGSTRNIRRLETGYIQSANWKEGVSGWRLTPLGIEFGATGGIFPPGSITFADIQNIATDRILGRDTAGSGVIEELSLGGGLAIAAGAINVVTEYIEDLIGVMLLDTDTIDATYDDTNADFFFDLKMVWRRKSLFDHFASVGNVGSGEDDLYSDTITAGQLANNGEKIEGYFSGTTAANANNKTFKFYFGGTALLNSGALALNDKNWSFTYQIIRVSASAIRYRVCFEYEGNTAQVLEVGELTGLTLANTQVLKITGEATSDNDIVAQLGMVEWKSAA